MNKKTKTTEGESLMAIRDRLIEEAKIKADTVYCRITRLSENSYRCHTCNKIWFSETQEYYCKECMLDCYRGRWNTEDLQFYDELFAKLKRLHLLKEGEDKPRFREGGEAPE